MRKNGLASIGKRALALAVALCMTLMMTPVAAFADDDEDMGDDRAAYAVDVKSAGEPKSQTVDGDVNADGGGVRAKSTGGGSATATVTGSVNAGDASFGVYVSGRSNGSQAIATVGDVSAGAGVHVDASVGTATLNAGDVKATAEGAENIDSNSFIASRGGTVTATLCDVESAFTGLSLSIGFYGGTVSVTADAVEADGVGIDASDGGGSVTAKVGDVFSGKTALWVTNEGGKAIVTVDGDALSSSEYGLVYTSLEGGEAKVVVSGTLSGEKGGVVLGSDAASLDLTAWEIASENGPVISGQGVDSFAKAVNYIVYVENYVEGVVLAARAADGSALDKSHGYDVAREGDKVILKVDVEEGYELLGVYNGKGEATPLAKDADGNYYVIVPRGGGIYLSALVADASEEFVLVPTIEALNPLGSSSASGASEDEEAADASGPAPLLTYDGVQVNELRFEMRGQVPTLRVTLSNTNGSDAEFDCGKFRVVNADDGSEVVFKVKGESESKAENEDKAEVKTLAANAAGIEVELIADANACKAGDRLNVHYDDQLLGMFTVA